MPQPQIRRQIRALCLGMCFDTIKVSNDVLGGEYAATAPYKQIKNAGNKSSILFLYFWSKLLIP